MNIKKIKIVTAEQIYSFNIDNEDIEFLKDVACFSSAINSNGDGSQEIKRRQRLGRAAMEESEKIVKNKHASLETKVALVHTLIFSVTVCVCVWIRKLDREEGREETN